jgi:hypothetical protein
VESRRESLILLAVGGKGKESGEKGDEERQKERMREKKGKNEKERFREVSRIPHPRGVIIDVKSVREKEEEVEENDKPIGFPMEGV